MVDLATLRGLQPALSRIPCIYYCHENQFAYPDSPHRARPLEPLMVQLYGALAADCLVFNSGWNRSSFLTGVGAFLKNARPIASGAYGSALGQGVCLPVPWLQLILRY